MPLCLRAQQDKFIDSLLNNRVILIPTYVQPVESNESMVLRMNFGQADLLDTTGISKLKDAQILSVDLVFSDYPSNQDLKTLNKKRYQNLFAAMPFNITDKTISWQMIRQMDGKDKESSLNLLHGWIINYRPKFTPAETEKEITYLERIIDSLPKPKPVEETKPAGKVRYWDVIYGGNSTAIVRTYLDRPVKTVSANKAQLQTILQKGDTLIGMRTQIARASRLLVLPQERAIKSDSVYVLLTPKPVFEEDKKDETKKEGSVYTGVVVNALSRNKFTNALIIADVTGSVSPYLGQLLTWLSQQETNSVRYLVCFNDGDNKRDDQKILGDAGGVYGEAYTDVSQAALLIERTMRKGNGGDMAENDCEAIIKSLSNYQDAKDVVLVADSWSPVRDIVLAKNIKRPVRVIVCGSQIGVHPDYITIALVTNGSLHFMNEDILDLTPLKEGKEMTIKNKQYKLLDGRVVEAVKLPAK